MKAWGEGELQRAINEFSAVVDLEAAGSDAQVEALRLRCAGLLRSGRFTEALSDAQAIVARLDERAQASGDDDGDGGGAEEAAVWHLHGLALVGCERVEEATGSFAKALRLHALEADEPGTAARGEHARRRVAHLTALFLDGARRAPAAALPLAVYQPPPAAAEADGGVGGGRALPPVFRLLLRPRFPPWPVELSIGGLLAAKGGSDGGGLLRVSLFGAFEQMPAEPHLCVVCQRAEADALVLFHIRIDGVIEVLSNSSDAAWEQLNAAVLNQPPSHHQLRDFEVLANGWQHGGRAARAFGALAREAARLSREGRGKEEREAASAERQRAKRQKELRVWLDQLGMGAFLPKFAKAGVDMEAVQYRRKPTSSASVSRPSASGGSSSPQGRRALRTAKAMNEKIAELEAEVARLNDAGAQQQATAKEGADHAECAEAVRQLRAELELERERGVEGEKERQRLLELVRAEGDRAGNWRATAEAFAADSDVLQQQLAQRTKEQRADVRSSRAALERRVDAVLKKVQLESSAAYHPLRRHRRRGRRPGGALRAMRAARPPNATRPRHRRGRRSAPTAAHRRRRSSAGRAAAPSMSGSAASRLRASPRATRRARNRRCGETSGFVYPI